MMAMVYKARASSKLRARIENNGKSEVSRTICQVIYSLFTAHIAAHSFAAADVYGKMFRQIIQPEMPSALTWINCHLLHTHCYATTYTEPHSHRADPLSTSTDGLLSISRIPGSILYVRRHIIF